MFSFGIFMIVCLVVCIVYVFRVDGVVNFSWEYVDVIIWMNIEVGVIVMVFCLFVMRVLIFVCR